MGKYQKGIQNINLNLGRDLYVLPFQFRIGKLSLHFAKKGLSKVLDPD